MKKSDAGQSQVDPRIADRAQKVREKEERRAFKRAFVVLVVMALAGVGVWLAYSPSLAVQRLVVTGVVSSSVAERLEASSVTEEVPMISVDAESLRQTLLSDPWVKDVSVEKRWPHTIRVIVEERSPTAWVRTNSGWQALSADGMPLEVDAEMIMPHVTGLAGTVLDVPHPSLEPALRFIEYLRPDLLLGTVVEIHGSQITANVSRRIVRLGRPTELEEKAAVLGVLIDEHADPGSVINLLSPKRPAVYTGANLEVGNISTYS